MLRSNLKSGDHHAIFFVLEVKRSKTLQKLNKKTVFIYILSFIFHDVSHAKTDEGNKYIIQLFNFVWLILLNLRMVFEAPYGPLLIDSSLPLHQILKNFTCSQHLWEALYSFKA